jgi:hypothetical protein
LARISVLQQVVELVPLLFLVLVCLLLEKAQVIPVHRGADSSQQLSSQNLGHHLTQTCLILQQVPTTRFCTIEPTEG